MVNAREDVRRASDVRHAVRDERLRHCQRDGQVAGAIINTGQNMAMQINHGLSDLASNQFKQFRPCREQGQHVNRVTGPARTFLQHARTNLELHPLHDLIHYA
jgi:hypothetical protein